MPSGDLTALKTGTDGLITFLNLLFLSGEKPTNNNPNQNGTSQNDKYITNTHMIFLSTLIIIYPTM